MQTDDGRRVQHLSGTTYRVVVPDTPPRSTGPLTFPTWPQLDASDIEAVTDVLRSNRLSQLSSGEVAAFEDELAEYHTRRHGIAVSSGTAAIHLALLGLGIGPGDEVAVPAHTFIASASPIVMTGATPVLVDIDPTTYCMSPDDLEAKVTTRTRAVVLVHLNGLPADVHAVADIAARHGLDVVEDTAQAIGASIDGRKVGSFGRIACFSFWEDKILTMGGEGGALLTNDSKLSDRLRRLRHHGEGPIEGTRHYCSHELGFNYRTTAMQAALGRSQLKRLDHMVAVRRTNAERLAAGLEDLQGIVPPAEQRGRRSSYWKFVVRVDQTAALPAAELASRLRARGIPALPRYPVPLTRQPALAPRLGRHPRCPVAETLSGQLFSLPVHPAIEDAHVDLMVGAIREELS